jgi:hypothetical protein
MRTFDGNFGQWELEVSFGHRVLGYHHRILAFYCEIVRQLLEIQMILFVKFFVAQLVAQLNPTEGYSPRFVCNEPELSD